MVIVLLVCLFVVRLLLLGRAHYMYVRGQRPLLGALVEVDEERLETALRDEVALEEGGEGAVAQRLGETGAEGLAGTGMLATQP